MINPQEVISHPLKPSSELMLFSVRHLATAVISQRKYVKSNINHPLSLQRLLNFEPYAVLDLKTLHCIHSNESVMRKMTKFRTPSFVILPVKFLIQTAFSCTNKSWANLKLLLMKKFRPPVPDRRWSRPLRRGGVRLRELTAV